MKSIWGMAFILGGLFVGSAGASEKIELACLPASHTGSHEARLAWVRFSLSPEKQKAKMEFRYRLDRGEFVRKVSMYADGGPRSYLLAPVGASYDYFSAEVKQNEYGMWSATVVNDSADATTRLICSVEENSN